MDVFLGATLSTYFKKIHFSYVVTVCTLKSIQYYAFELLSHIINFFYRRTLIDFVIGTYLSNIGIKFVLMEILFF